MLLLVPAHPGCPGQNPQSHKTVCVCVCSVWSFYCSLHCGKIAAREAGKPRSLKSWASLSPVFNSVCP